jgi:endonuclease YncB( thermonuclease family)
MFRFCSYRLVILPASLAAVLAGIPAFPAEGREQLPGPFAATVERVIDGDSLAVRVSVWLGLEVSTIVRLRGIDAPELAGRCPEERRRAAAARDALATLVAGGTVSLAAVETDKYGGRVVADVVDDSGRPLAAALVAAGLARPYDGRRRAGWCQP